MRFKILHTEWSDGLGGQEKRILSELTGMSKRGHYVALACKENARIKKEAEKIPVDIFTLPMRKPYDIESIIKLTKIIKKINFDIVNTHSGVDSWIGGIASKLAGVKVLIRTRHLNIPLKRNLLNFVHYLPDMYVTCGENMRNNLIKNCGFPKEKVVSISTGISSEFFEIKKDPEMKTKYGLKNNAIVITNVGILRSVKGHEVTLKAVRHVVDKFPDAVFFFAGDGPRKRALEKMADELGISSQVIFAGFINNIKNVYSFSDIIVLSSWSEGLPQSILQAMASGIPVVATKVGGVPEIVFHEKTGILVQPGDFESLSNGIIRLLKDHVLREQIINNARELVINEHTLTRMLDKTESLYNDLFLRKRKL
jgi:glycosyltransferase involved in cell wall biosynthesis